MAKSQGKRSRKHGRNASWCNAYKLSGKAEIAKARRVWRALLRQPWDKALQHCYTNISPLARQRAGLPLELGQEITKAKSPVLLRKEEGITLTQVQKQREMAGD